MKIPKNRSGYIFIYVLLALALIFSFMTLLLQLQSHGLIQSKNALSLRQAQFLAESGMEIAIRELETESQEGHFRLSEFLLEEQSYLVEVKQDQDGIYHIWSEGRNPRARSSKSTYGCYLKNKFYPNNEANISFSLKGDTITLQGVLLSSEPEKSDLILLKKDQSLLWGKQDIRVRELVILSVADCINKITVTSPSVIREDFIVDGDLHVTAPLECDSLIVKGELSFDGEGRLFCQELYLEGDLADVDPELLEIGSVRTSPPKTTSRFMPLYYKAN